MSREQLLVGGGEQLEHIDAAIGFVARRGSTAGVPAIDDEVRGAHLLALVAAVQPVTERRARVDREDSWSLEQPREAPARVDDPASTMAPVGQESMHR